MGQRRLFQTCIWGCGASSNSGAYFKPVFGGAALIRQRRLFQTCIWGCGDYSAAALISNLYLGVRRLFGSGAYFKPVFGGAALIRQRRLFGSGAYS